MTGVACQWNSRGFGFIRPDDGEEDVFCHVSAIKDGNCLREGDKVEYSIAYDDRKGKYRAEGVTGGYDERDSRDDRGRGRDDYDRRDRDRGRDRY